MRRRDFIVAIGGAAAWPLATEAQQGGVPTIGHLSVGTRETTLLLLPAFRKGLSEMGVVEGRNLVIEYRYGEQ
jgi:putative tryptophan/tyrosine transport system substrate-binding protein